MSDSTIFARYADQTDPRLNPQLRRELKGSVAYTRDDVVTAAPQQRKHEGAIDPSVGHVHHLTQLDLARRWRLSTRTLERWRWLGQGPAYLKLGGTIVYRLEDVELYEASHRRTG
jgi:hypothetical protein